MLTRRVRAVWLTLTIVVALVATSADNAVAADTRHSGPHWVWFGPRTWHAAYGTYGITVASPSGQDVLDLGFSATTCSPGANYGKSVGNHFAALRRQYGSGAFRIRGVSAIVHPRGTSGNYRRQSLAVTIRSRGVTYFGDFTFDYNFLKTVSSGFSTVNYCYQRSVGTYAPTSRYIRSSRPVLRRVFNSLAYSGPGACLGSSGTCDPDL